VQKCSEWLMPGVQFMPYPHEYRCPLGLGGEAGVDALLL
jgi:diaminobutyrate-2-oxoglutarate transaminase